MSEQKEIKIWIVFSQDVENGRFYDLKAYFDETKARKDGQNNRVGKKPAHYTGMFEAEISKDEILDLILKHWGAGRAILDAIV